MIEKGTYARINTWVLEAQAGDNRARELLLKSFSPLLLKMAGHYRGNESFEDAYQDGVEVFLTAVIRYDPARNHYFSGYIRSYLDFYYRKRREGRFDRSVRAATSLDAPVGQDGSPLASLIPDPVQPVEAFHQNLEKNHLLDRLDGALVQLPEGQRTAVTAYYLEGQSQKSIAAASQLSEAAVKMRVHRGLLRLRELMRD